MEVFCDIGALEGALEGVETSVVGEDGFVAFVDDDEDEDDVDRNGCCAIVVVLSVGFIDSIHSLRIRAVLTVLL